jgi:glycerol dehydrogenase
MKTIFVSCGQYIQGRDLLNQVGDHVSAYGKKCFIIADEFVLRMIGKPLALSMEKAGLETIVATFSGECCREEITRLTAAARRAEADVVMAIGGGNALDTGKAVAFELGKDSIVFPTIAATDSPTTSIAVVYSAEHLYEGVLKFHRSPSMVFVDSEIIAKAPPRFLIAGMGDALATKYEAQACFRSAAKNLKGGCCTLAGLCLADLTYDVVREHGISAKLSAEQGLVTPSLEKVIEANILLSGLGWENCGVAVAHGFHGAVTAILRSHVAYHGEKVAFGVLVQMVMEGRPTSEIIDLLNFYREIGLPVSLSELGVDHVTTEEISMVAAKMCLPGAHAHNMPFPISEKMVADAIRMADEIGMKAVGPGKGLCDTMRQEHG